MNVARLSAGRIIFAGDAEEKFLKISNIYGGDKDPPKTPDKIRGFILCGKIK